MMDVVAVEEVAVAVVTTPAGGDFQVLQSHNPPQGSTWTYA